MDQWISQNEQWVRQHPVEQIYIAVAVLALTVIPFVLFSLLKTSKSITTVLAGLSGSGKTVIFYQKGKIKPVHLVDVPGHSRLKPKLDEFLPNAAGLIFVADALDFLPNCRPAAEDKLRTSRNAISTTNISDEFMLGVPGQSFTFEQYRNKVTVAKAPGLTGEVSQVEQVHQRACRALKKVWLLFPEGAFLYSILLSSLLLLLLKFFDLLRFL